ncbi:KaiC domain-containing protein [Halobaculum sp. WSA2]|uniref:KaiC domain-containing protein n=1 Tax=Halobaculum saliterrae TaxID=2073113 RepID=A0A6B0SUF8_9EURY|nr:KaiC domain-containing protein [Halobaculum saliterrae]MXR41276.1 KaiC domain-containing protein [Halobaculum saliterrae]
MSDDDDWFERALREADRDDGGEAEGGDAETGPDEDRTDDSDAGTDAERTDVGDAAADTETPDPADEDVFGGGEFGGDGFDGDEFGGDGFDGDEFGGEEFSEDGFDGEGFDGDGFGGLDGNGGVDDGGGAPDRPTGDAEDDRATPPATSDDADPFGGASGEPADGATAGRDPIDGDGGPANDPFGEDFGAAMERSPGAGGPDAGAPGGGGADFGGGFGNFGGGAGGDDFGGGPEFDEEEFDSDIDRIDVGIEGLDEMILGGVPERSLMAVIGSAGTGKTTFGLQFLNEALENDGDAVYITLEESKEAILSTAEEKGWEYRRYAEEDRLAVIAMDPIEMANSLDSIRDDISRLITDFGADRLVLDSVSLLEMMYDSPSKRRSEVFDFARSLKQAGVTTMLTSEASQENAYASRHGIVEYLTDAVFVLQYVRPSDFRETRLAVEIQKIRDANHSRETKPYEIMNDGISVYRQANIF